MKPAKNNRDISAIVAETVLQPESLAPKVAERLRVALKESGGNNRISKRTGIPLRTLGYYLEGHDMKGPVLVAIADACGISVEWLATGRGRMRAEWVNYKALGLLPEQQPEGTTLVDGPVMPIELEQQAATSARYVSIPRYDVRASAGGGNLVTSEKRAGHLAFDEDFIRNALHRRPEDLVLITADGDSMDPTIRDGDILLVDISVQNINNNSLYILDVSGSLLVKRAQLRLDGSVLIMSDNPKYQPEVIVPSERTPIRIIGQVIYQAGPVRS